MEEYAGRVLADRYRLPRLPRGEDPPETPAFDTYSGQEVLARQVPLPEVVSAEVVFPGTEDGEPPDVLSPEDDPGQRALRAAAAAARIPDHPRLVQVYDVFLDGGSLWIISEQVSARPLSELIADRELNPYRAAEVGADVLAALRAVHAQRWIHRNVTADTVLVCDDGRAILSGLVVGAAEEAICGFDPVPAEAPKTAGALAAQDASDDDRPEPDGPPFGRRQTAPYPPRDPYGAAPDELDVLSARKVMTSPALKRAWEIRLDLVGPLTERWAPEQTGPLAVRLTGLNGLSDRAEPTAAEERYAEIGPPCDLWALGVLLFRVIQGRPPFPEEDTHQLVELVRTEPPAFVEECGPLRPIVESLLHKDPRTRPDPEEVRGWLRSLIRTAPEPDIGRDTVELPAPPPHKDVELRRRGEMVRRNRPGVPAHHGRHARARTGRRWLGTLLVGFLLLAVALALAVAAVFLPRDRGGIGSPARDDEGRSGNRPGSPPATDLSTDVELYQDPVGFQLEIHRELLPKGRTKQGQVLFNDGDDVNMFVIPGRDTVKKFGDDLATYQKDKEPELRPYRESDWGSVGSVERLNLRGQDAIQGEYSWRDDNNAEFYARNLVILHDGRYHVVLVVGPERDRSDISRFFEKAAETYRVTK